MLRQQVKPARFLHRLQEIPQLRVGYILRGVLHHALAHLYRGVGHDPDHRVIAARHLPDGGHGQSGSHAHQYKLPGPLGQYRPQLGQHVPHHLGLDSQKQKITLPGRLFVGARGAAQFLGQRLGFAVIGQQYLPGTCRPGAGGPGQRAAHVAASNKTKNRMFHPKVPPCTDPLSGRLHIYTLL